MLDYTVRTFLSQDLKDTATIYVKMDQERLSSKVVFIDLDVFDGLDNAAHLGAVLASRTDCRVYREKLDRLRMYLAMVIEKVELAYKELPEDSEET